MNRVIAAANAAVRDVREEDDELYEIRFLSNKSSDVMESDGYKMEVVGEKAPGLTDKRFTDPMVAETANGADVVIVSSQSHNSHLKAAVTRCIKSRLITKPIPIVACPKKGKSIVEFNYKNNENEGYLLANIISSIYNSGGFDE